MALREKIGRYLLWGAVTLAIGVGTLQAMSEARLGRALEPGSVTPAFSAPRRGGGQFELTETRGQVVLLSFWASWCAPCARELPVLQRLEKDYGPRGVKLVTANLDDPDDRDERIERFFRKHGDGGSPLVVFPGDETVRSWRALRLPTLYVLDANGAIVAGHSSLQQEAQLRTELERALSAVPRPSS